ncbi:MAG: hypothetical protein O3C21_18940 [Verrucomicrobia bacterium]|nr:hypothetical protein [Verrucomicrobiota bacterium]
MAALPPALPLEPGLASSPGQLSESDASHLQLLAIFHYILGGLTFFFGLLPLLYVAFGFVMLANPGIFDEYNGAPGEHSHQTHEQMQEDVLFGKDVPPEPIAVEAMPEQELELDHNWDTPSQRVPPELKVFGGFMVAFGLLGTLFLFALATLMVVTGRSLQKRKRRVLCLVTAGLSLISVPFGTALGVFTIIVLQRPAIVAAFQRK